MGLPRARVLWAVVALSIAASLVSSQEANICVEEVSPIGGTWLAEYPSSDPAASKYALVSEQNGTIWLTPLPALSSGIVADATPFLSIPETLLGAEAGLLSFAFHPDFLSNGRLFVSYICNGTLFPGCQGPCACSAAQGCPAVCPDNTVIAEYSVSPSSLNPAAPSTVTAVGNVINFGRPSDGDCGGQIWFDEGLLYFSSGDGGVNMTAQLGTVPLGKILRVDVDTPTTTKQTFGNYSIPTDNPFVSDPTVAPEVWALGFRNPWRCSVSGPSTICGDVGERSWEEVDVVTAGGNYGWPYEEGPDTFRTPAGPVIGGNFTKPVLYYKHPVDGIASIIGGYVYSGTASPCLQGKYVYGDVVAPPDVATFPPLTPITANIKAKLTVAGGQQIPQPDFLFSWSVDNSGELYRLSSSGVYRVVDVSACGLTCQFGVSPAGAPGGLLQASPPPPKSAWESASVRFGFLAAILAGVVSVLAL